MITFILWFCVLVFVTRVAFGVWLAAKPLFIKPKEVATEPVVARSFAADKVIDTYQSLPAEHRNMADIRATVDALDLKYKIAEVNSHLIAHGYSGFECMCGRDKGGTGYGNRKVYNACKRFPEYIALCDAAKTMERALKERERALEVAKHRDEVAGVKFDLDRVAEITANMRSEASIIQSVNQELIRGK